MLTVEDALARVLAATPALRTERVPLHLAHGRLLAAPVTAPADLPGWDNSAMDGYAVRSSDCPGSLRIIETVPAGRVGRLRVEAGTATRIFTGAPIPEGADCVVMQEDTERRGDHVDIRGTAAFGQHIRRRGADLHAGDEVLAAGRVLTPGALGLVAAMGVPEVPVAAAPRVAIVSTGDEVVPPGVPLQPGQIHSSNNHALAGLVLAAGGVPVDLGNVPDDPAAIRSAFQEAAAEADVVVSTGGVSVGDFDHVKGVLGAGVHFWKVAMKPGKPLAFGTVGGKPFFGLPGNPVSCMVNFLQFVRPMLRKMQGDPRPFLPVLRARLSRPLRRQPGRVELVRVSLAWEGGVLVATPAGGHQGSGNVRSMAEAHGFAMLDATRDRVEGEVAVQVYDPGFGTADAPNYRWGALRSAESRVTDSPDGDPCC